MITTTKTITICASAEQVWEAITDPGMMRIWMSDTDIEIHTTWEKGSPISIHHQIYKNAHVYKGTVLTYEEGHTLAYSSWSNISRLPDVPENYTKVEFTLTPSGQETTLTVTHSNLVALAAYEHANFYWNTALALLKKLLEEPADRTIL
jgi:uncharacterized protein YndB with AHSA1/START domain